MEETNQALDQNLIETEITDPEFNLASKEKRFVNLVVDVICYYALFFALAVLLGATGMSGIIDSKGVAYLVAFSVHFIYHCTLETYFGKTVGKMITKTKVVDEMGNKITFFDAATRSLCRLIPFEGFSFLGNGLGLHDRLSKTRVING